MLDYHSRSVTNTWPEPLTHRPAVDGIDPAATTMAQPTFAMTAAPAAAPAYAWSAEIVADDPTPTKRSRGLVRPMAIAGIGGVAAAAAATALIAFGGQASSPAVSTSTVSTPIAASHVATPPMTTTPTHPAPVSHHRTSNSQPASTTYQEPDRTNTTSDQSSDGQPHGEQWRPWHDTTPHTSNWTFFRPPFDYPFHHDGDHDRSRNNGAQQSSARHSDSSSHGSE